MHTGYLGIGFWRLIDFSICFDLVVLKPAPICFDKIYANGL
jgi:hypothetical protein